MSRRLCKILTFPLHQQLPAFRALAPRWIQHLGTHVFVVGDPQCLPCSRPLFCPQALLTCPHPHRVPDALGWGGVGGGTE